MSPHKCGKHDKACCEEHSERKKKSTCSKKSSTSNERFERVYVLDPNYQNVNSASVRVGTQKMLPSQAIPSSQFQTETYAGSNGVAIVNPSPQMGYGLSPFPLNVLPVSGGFVMPQGNTETRNCLPNGNFLGSAVQQSQGTGLNSPQGIIHPPQLNLQGNGQGVQALGIPVCFLANGNKFESGSSEGGNSNQMERGKNNGCNQSDTLGHSSSKRYYNHDRHLKDKSRRRRSRTSSRHNRTYRIPHYLTDAHYYERPPIGDVNFSSDSESCSVSSEGNYFEEESYPYERRIPDVYQMRRINRYSTPSRYVFRKRTKDDEGEYVVRPAARSLPVERTTTMRGTLTDLPVKDEPYVPTSERLESGDQIPTIRNELHQHNVETQKRIYDLEKKIDELKACLCPSDTGEPIPVKSSSIRNPSTSIASVKNQSGSNASVRNQSGSSSTVRNQSGSIASVRNQTIHSSLKNSEKFIQTEPKTLNVEHIALIPVDQFKPCHCQDPRDIYKSSEEISVRHQSSRRPKSGDLRFSTRTKEESFRNDGEIEEESMVDTGMSQEYRRESRRNPDGSIRASRRDQGGSKTERRETPKESIRESSYRSKASRRATGMLQHDSRMDSERPTEASRREESRRERRTFPEESTKDSRREQESEVSFRRTSPGPLRKVCCVTTELDECTDIIECPMNRCKCGGTRTPEIVYESEEESSTSLFYVCTDKQSNPTLNDDSIYSDNNNVQNYVLTCHGLPNGFNFNHLNNSNNICYEGMLHALLGMDYYCNTETSLCDYSSSRFQKINKALDNNVHISGEQLDKHPDFHLFKNIVLSYFENGKTNSIKGFEKMRTCHLNILFNNLIELISSWKQHDLNNILESIKDAERYSRMSEILGTFFKIPCNQNIFFPYNPLQTIIKTHNYKTNSKSIDTLNNTSEKFNRHNKSKEQYKPLDYETLIDHFDTYGYGRKKSIDFTHPLIGISPKPFNSACDKNNAITYTDEYWYNPKIPIEFCPTFSCLPLIQERLDFKKSKPYTRVPYYVNSQTQSEQWRNPNRSTDKYEITEQSSTSDVTRKGNICNSTLNHRGSYGRNNVLENVLPSDQQRLGLVTQRLPSLNTFILSIPTTTFANESSQTSPNYSYFSRDTSSADTYQLSPNRLSQSSSYTGTSNDHDMSNTYHTYTSFQNDPQINRQSQLCRECGQPLNSVPSSGCKCPFIRECSCPPISACNCPTNHYYPSPYPYSLPNSSFLNQRATGVQVRQVVKPQATQYSDIQLIQGAPGYKWPSDLKDAETQCIDCERTMIIEQRGNETVKRWICKPLDDDVNIAPLNPVPYQPPPPQHHSSSQFHPPSNIDLHHQDQTPNRITAETFSSGQFQKDHSSIESQPPPQYWAPPDQSTTAQSATNSRDSTGKHALSQTETWNPTEYNAKPQLLFCEVCGKPHDSGNTETQFQVVCKKCMCKMSTGEGNANRSQSNFPRGSYICTENSLDPVLHYNYAWQCENCKHWNKQENIADNKSAQEQFLSSQIKLKCECAIEDSFSEPKVHQLYENKNVGQIERENSIKVISNPQASNSQLHVSQNMASDFLWQCNTCGKWNSTNPDKFKDHHEWHCKKCNLTIIHPDFEGINEEKTGVKLRSRYNGEMRCYECHQCNGYWMCKTCKEIGTEASSMMVYGSQRNVSREPTDLILKNDRERISALSESKTQTSSTTLDQRRPSRTVFAKDSKRKSSRPSQRDSLKTSYDLKDKPSILRSIDRQRSTFQIHPQPSVEMTEDRPGSARSKISSGYIDGHEILLVEETPGEKQSTLGGSLRDISMGAEPHESTVSGKESETIKRSQISGGTARSRISTGYIDGHKVLLVDDDNRPEMQSASERSTKLSDVSKIRSALSDSKRSRISGYIDGKKIILADDNRSVDKQSSRSTRSTKGSGQVIRERSLFARKSRSPQTSSQYSPDRTKMSSEYAVQQGDEVSQVKPGRKAIPRNVFAPRKRSLSARPDESIDQNTEIRPRRRGFPNTTFIRKSPKNVQSLNYEDNACDNNICKCTLETDFEERTSGAACSVIGNRICKCKRPLQLYRCENHSQFGMLHPSRVLRESRQSHTSQVDSTNKYNEIFVGHSRGLNENTQIINKTRSMSDRVKMFNAKEIICHCRNPNNLKPCIRRRGTDNLHEPFDTTKNLYGPRIETQRDSTTFKKTNEITTKVIDDESEGSNTEGVEENTVIHNFNMSVPGECKHQSCERKEQRPENNYSESIRSCKSSNEHHSNIKKRIYVMKKSNKCNKKHEREGKRSDSSKENCVKNEKNKKKKISSAKNWNKEQYSNLLIPEILNKIEEANRSSGNSNTAYSLKKVKLHNQKKSIYVLVKRRKKNEDT